MKSTQLWNLSLIFALLVAIDFYTSCQNNNEPSKSSKTTPVVDDKKEKRKELVATSYETPVPLKNLKSKELIYAWVDKLNIRDKASLKAKAIASVDTDEVLEFTGVKSGNIESPVKYFFN